MKIYFVDEKKKNLCIKKRIEEITEKEIDYKENINGRINKSDIVITTDFNDNYDEYKKVNNLIIITNRKEKESIFKMTEYLNTLDIVYDNTKNYEYIADRISRILQ